MFLSFFRKRRAVAIVELAVTAGFGLMMLLATMSLGYRYFMQSRLDDAVREVSRVCSARAGMINACLSVATVKTELDNRLDGSFNSNNILIYAQSYSLASTAYTVPFPGSIFTPSEDDETEVTSESLANASDLTQGSYVSYEVDYDLGLNVPFVPSEVWRLRSYVLIYNEE